MKQLSPDELNSVWAWLTHDLWQSDFINPDLIEIDNMLFDELSIDIYQTFKMSEWIVLSLRHTSDNFKIYAHKDP